MMEPLTAAPDDYETWQNLTHSRFIVKRFSAKGDLMDQMIGGNKTFHITTRERHINEERTEGEQDPFSNGTFTPVRLLDSTDDAEQIADNPALITETEMKDLVKANVKALEKRVKEVRNPVVLERLLQVANDNDATVGRVQVIKERLTEVSPSLYSEVESH